MTAYVPGVGSHHRREETGPALRVSVVTTIDETPYTAPAGEPENSMPENPTPEVGAPQKKKRRAKRRLAKGLAWSALLFTAALVLAEPWLLLPTAAMLAAIALWD